MAGRESTMSDLSVAEIQEWREDNATMPESSYFSTLKDMVFSKLRGGWLIKQRTFAGIIMDELNSFERSWPVAHLFDIPWVKHILLGKAEAKGSVLGLTDPKPDYSFGLKSPMFAEPPYSLVSAETHARIEVAPKTRHAFFAVEDKGPQDSIEEAENPVIRSGTTIVAAHRTLRQRAKDDNEEAEKPGADLETIAYSCSWVPKMAEIHVH